MFYVFEYEHLCWQPITISNKHIIFFSLFCGGKNDLSYKEQFQIPTYVKYFRIKKIYKILNGRDQEYCVNQIVWY